MPDLTPASVAGWWTLQEAATQWPDVQGAPDTLPELYRVLMVGHELCLAYHPVDAAGQPIADDEVDVPERVRTAQLLQAKAQWNAERTGVGDLIGPDGRAVRAYPMDWQVKNLLRPDDGTPRIG